MAQNGLLSIIADAYQRNIGQPFAQVAGNGLRGLLGLDPADYADGLGMEAYRNAQALSNTPTPLALAAVPAALVKGVKGAKAVKDAAPRAEALETARKNAVKMLGLPENNTAMDRANAMPEFSKTLYQGMRDADSRGNWYLNHKDLEGAYGYLQNRPVVAEFRGPSTGLVSQDPGRTFGPRFTQDVADIIGGKNAQDLLRMARPEGESHADMIRFLRSRLGNGGSGEEAALDVYNKSKAKTKGFSGDDVTLLHRTTPVRYATAAFDPARRFELDPLASVMIAPTLAGLGLLGIGPTSDEK